MRTFEIHRVELPVPYCLIPEYMNLNWIVFDDGGYISKDDMLYREVENKAYHIKEYLLMEVMVPNENWNALANNGDPTKTVKMTAVVLYGCTIRQGERFRVTSDSLLKYEECKQ